eukprot:scaffold2804_cov181-Amphora_coffeaeformis.AAC.32
MRVVILESDEKDLDKGEGENQSYYPFRATASRPTRHRATQSGQNNTRLDRAQRLNSHSYSYRDDSHSRGDRGFKFSGRSERKIHQSGRIWVEFASIPRTDESSWQKHNELIGRFSCELQYGV